RRSCARSRRPGSTASSPRNSFRPATPSRPCAKPSACAACKFCFGGQTPAAMVDAMLQTTSVKEALASSSPRDDFLARGWVRTRRDAKTFSFLELNDGSCLKNLQVIADAALPNYAEIQRLTTGASV